MRRKQRFKTDELLSYNYNNRVNKVNDEKKERWLW